MRDETTSDTAHELMAAMTAKWNACEFCVGAHGAIAARVLGRPVVDAALHDVQQAELPARLRATLAFLEGPGETGAALRHAMAERAAGGPALEAPYDGLARQIGQAAYKVTDEQVASVARCLTALLVVRPALVGIGPAAQR